jgi:predicted nucleic acid-binding protein
MTCFVDTSALLAVLDAADIHHARARRRWERLLSEGRDLVVTNYILVETCALLQRRFGVDAVRMFHEDVRPVLRVGWVSEASHEAAVTALLTASRKKLSLVDCVSFHTMRSLGIRDAFAFDRHFSEQGFHTLS